MGENSYDFNTRDKIHLVFTPEKVNFLFILYVSSKTHARKSMLQNYFFF